MAEVVRAPQAPSHLPGAAPPTAGPLHDLRTGRGIALVALVACEIGWLASRAALRGPVRWLPVLVVLALHGALMETERRHPRLPRGSVTAATVVVAVTAIGLAPFGSQDLYLYATYGRMVTAHHANPYLVAPGAFPHDPLFHHMAPAWTGTRTMYGPGFTGLSALGALLYGRSALVARLFFQSVAGLSLITAVVWLQRRRASTAALVLVGLSPVLVAVVNGGHNDLLAGVLAMVGVAAARDGRHGRAGVWLGLAIAVKALVLPVLGAVLIVLALRRAWAGLGRVVATAAGVLLVGYAAAGGFSALHPLTAMADATSRVSLWVSISHLVRRAGGSVDASDLSKMAMVFVIVLVVVAIARRRRHPEMATLATVVGAIVVLGVLYVLPWYAALIIPVAALTANMFTQRAVHVAASVLLVAYVQPPGQRASALSGASTVGHATGLVLGAIAIALAVAPAARALRRDGGDEAAVTGSAPRL